MQQGITVYIVTEPQISAGGLEVPEAISILFRCTMR
jgi:hypothetical protein